MKKPKIRLTLIDHKGAHPCHRGHKIGDSFDFDTQRGELCPTWPFPTSTSSATAATSPAERTGPLPFAARMWM